jgi:hypothetical protein
MATGTGRIQFVISGPFLLLLLLAAGFMTAGFYLYTHRPPPPKPQNPPYYVNRISTAVRPCFQCVASDGTLKNSAEWKMAKPAEIPAGEVWWFSPIADPPLPTNVDGVPMLAVHPAKDNQKPWEGFDKYRVLLVVFQDLEPKFAIEHPAPLPPEPATVNGATTSPSDNPPPSPAPQQPTP